MRSSVKLFGKYLLALAGAGVGLILLGYLFDYLTAIGVITYDEIAIALSLILGIASFVSAWLVFDLKNARKLAYWLGQHSIVYAIISFRSPQYIEYLKSSKKSKTVGMLLIILGLLFIVSAL